MEKGNLSINSENILPIIKKWLYSDLDIFVRELVSNGADAITKLNRLESMGELALPADEEFSVRVVLDAAARTIKFIDNGIGMTADEIKKYINQIAFSGATDFINKYKDKEEAENEIIGHFGLGFYSAFMVASKVEIESLSYKEDAKAAHWSCEGGIEFELDEGNRQERGTTITLHVGDDGENFLNDYNLRGVLKKYCSFMPFDIYFENVAAKDKEDIEENKKPINDKNPLWLKKASDLKDDDYKAFYRQTFVDFNPPLFWIHLNMDYPFRLKGILYFPKLRHELESTEGQVKLFSNQVFVADNIREVIPEFLLLLKGAIDCPDLPLNVSRSFLQNDGYVEKMSSYIIKKVADKLTTLCKKERKKYNKYWGGIDQFIKYGCVRQSDFYEKCRDAVLYKTTKNEYYTMDEYFKRNEEKLGKTILYTNDPQGQSQYIRLIEEQGLDVVLLTTRLDRPFTTHIEIKEGGDLHFARVDSNLNELIDGDDAPEEGKYDALIKTFDKAINDKLIVVEVQSFKNPDMPAMVFVNEEGRRMEDIMNSIGVGYNPNDIKEKDRLVLNSSNELVKILAEEDLDDEDAKVICSHIWDMAVLGHGGLSPERMRAFIERNAVILREYVR